MVNPPRRRNFCLALSHRASFTLVAVAVSVAMGAAFNTLIFTLMAYFVVLNLTVERAYCHAPLERSSTVLLVPETVDFCEKANPLFMLRPEWLRLAT